MKSILKFAYAFCLKQNKQNPLFLKGGLDTLILHINFYTILKLSPYLSLQFSHF